MRTLQESIMDDDEEVDRKMSKDVLLQLFETWIDNCIATYVRLKANEDHEGLNILRQLGLLVRTGSVQLTYGSYTKSMQLFPSQDVRRADYYMELEFQRSSVSRDQVKISIFPDNIPNKPNLKSSISKFEKLLVRSGYVLMLESEYRRYYAKELK